MTCGVFIVNAANSNSWLFTQKYSIDDADNTLTDGEWNQLMNDLDNLIPEWTVMAFLTDECPVGWDPLPQSDWRFLMWTLGQDFWYIGWTTNNQIKLQINQLPTHSHLIRFSQVGGFWDEDDARYVPIDYFSDYWPQWGSSSANWGNITNWQAINIAPSYIKVRYCIKWNYSLAEDSCPSGYSSSVTWCNGAWYIFDSTGSTYGSMTCGKCTPRPCPGGYTECSISPSNLWSSVVRNRHSWDDICVRYWCCVFEEPSREDIHQDIGDISPYVNQPGFRNNGPIYSAIIADYCSN